MRGAVIRGATVLALVFLMAGCQIRGMHPDAGSSGDNTGDLGSSLRSPSPADVYVELGGAYLAEGKIGEALENTRKAILADPRCAGAYTLLGVVRQRLGQMEPAGKAFKKAVELAPHDPYALNALGSWLCAWKRYGEADPYFRWVLKDPLYPTPWIASYNAGSCAEKRGDVVQAEKDYRAALSANPRFAPALLCMAFITFEQKRFLSSRAYLQRYAEVAPHTADSLWLGVRTEKRLGDREQMAGYATKLRVRFPDSEQARFLETLQ